MNKEKLEKQDKTSKPKRDEKGRLLPGNTANPKGRPKFSLVSILKEKLQECPPGEDKTTYASKLIKKMLDMALEDGNDQQIKNILNYVEGMPKQSMDLGLQKDIREISVEIKDGNSKD